MRNTVGAFHRLHMEYLRNIINSDVDTEALKITSVLSNIRWPSIPFRSGSTPPRALKHTVSVTTADNFRDKLMTYITTSICYARNARMLPKESQLYAAAQKLAPC
ncbi:MAG: hypothetical protein IJ244_07865 [Bacteroidaceae bacterium]|nr:hypothetical protein [Bacteroidaceae bacterium]